MVLVERIQSAGKPDVFIAAHLAEDASTEAFEHARRALVLVRDNGSKPFPSPSVEAFVAAAEDGR